MDPEHKGKAALLAAVSALGLSLGVTIPSNAAADESQPGASQIKLDSQHIKASSQIKGESQFLKGSSQVKVESQFTKGSSQVKGEAQYLKGSSQIKGESQQQKDSEGYDRPK